MSRFLLASAAVAIACAARGQDGPTGPSYVPDLSAIVARSGSEIAAVVERYSDDRAALLRRFGVEHSSARRSALRSFSEEWFALVGSLDFDALGQEGRIDHVLLRSRLRHELDRLSREETLLAETRPLLPFAEAVFELEEARRRLDSIVPETAAAALARLADEIEKTRKAVEAGTKSEPGEGAIRATPVVARRGARILDDLRGTLESWFRHYDGYHPSFSWWTREPHKKADEAFKAYAKFLREKVVGLREGEDEPIVGDPIGREALLVDFVHERIPYGPEDLVALAEREIAWCEERLREASREMGFENDWKKALERVKSEHVQPGLQPDLVREFAREAIAFVEQNDLVTVPPLARDVWRLEMLSPQAQKESPFFLGGETIRVAFPTDAMAHEDKWMSLRGNNVHFARATVHHELIPGHHLQGFMAQRHHPHRRLFATPFWTEGGAVWWEMLLWDLGFPKSPENRIGMLFWRLHRGARVVFSLGFHLGTMTPEQCVDFLVERVGHERANATAEVRRSFAGDYSPLYQAAYLVGALQFRALHDELVRAGRMTNRSFHDAILEGGRMPVEMVRARLTGEPLARDQAPRWKFAGDLAGPR